MLINGFCTQCPQYTHLHLRRQQVNEAELASESGWSHEGLARFNELAQLVKNDRVWLRGKEFNHALYKVFVHNAAGIQNQIRNKDSEGRTI
jgi:hypothetical protein